MNKLQRKIRNNEFLNEQLEIGNLMFDDRYATPHVATNIPTKVILEKGQSYLSWKARVHYHFKKEGIVFDKETYNRYHAI